MSAAIEASDWPVPALTGLVLFQPVEADQSYHPRASLEFLPCLNAYSTEHRAQSTEHRVCGSEYSTEYIVFTPRTLIDKNYCMLHQSKVATHRARTHSLQLAVFAISGAATLPS